MIRQLRKSIEVGIAGNWGHVAAAIVLSVTLSTLQLSGVAMFLPVLGMLSGEELSTLHDIPFLGRLVRLLPEDRYQAIVILVVLICGVLILRGICNMLSQRLQFSIRNKVNYEWQSRLVVHILKLPHLAHTRENAARLIHIFSAELRNITDGAAASIQLISAAIQIGLILSFLLVLSPEVMMWLILVIALLIAPSIVLVRHLISISEKDAMLARRSGERMIDVVRRLELIDIFATAGREAKTALAIQAEYLAARMRMESIRLLSPFALEIGAAILISAIILKLAGAQVGVAIVSQFVIFVGALMALQPQLVRISNGIGSLARVNASLRQINEILQLPTFEPVRTRDTIDSGGSVGIELQSVSFSFGEGADEKTVLRDVNVTIPAGKLTMLFGASGAGKTTFLKLLQRLLLPSSGKILLEHADIEQIADDNWRSFVLLMGQDNVILSDSILANTIYGEERADRSRAREALEKAAAWDFVSKLPNGLDADAGSDGRLLSGGQRQRIALARVFYNNPRVLLLDEPTSALDREVEVRIIERLLELRKAGVTIVMSTHKIDLASYADHLLWFDKETIKQGRFEDFSHELENLGKRLKITSNA